MSYLNLLESNELAYVRRIEETLCHHEEVIVVSLIGSLAKGHYSADSDIDILVLVRDQNFDLNEYRRYACEVGFDSELKDDAYDCSFNGRNISLLFKEYDLFLNYVNSILNGGKIEIEFRPWAYGGLIHDVILFDIRNEIILTDKLGKLGEISNDLKRTYPSKLKEMMLRYTRSFILGRLKALDRFGNNPLVSEIIKGELMINFARYCYAVHGHFNPGLKHIFSEGNIDFLRREMPELLRMAEYRGRETTALAEYIKEYLNE